MKKRLLTLVETESGNSADSTHEQQLSLFEWQHPTTITCLAVDDTHGASFLQAIRAVRPGFFVDFRRFPHFDMTSLDRGQADSVMKNSGARYLHLSLEFVGPKTAQQRWTWRKMLLDKLGWIRTTLIPLSGAGMGFVSTKAELEMLHECAQQIPGWKIKILK